MQKVANLILCRLLGWEITGKIPEDVQKAVIIVAPHTSLWDFVYGRLAFWVLDIPVRFMINEKYFIGPLGWLLKALGGQPVRQTRPTRLLLEIFDHFKANDSFFLVITPEGTRKKVDRWKKGFYQIALQNEVPVVMAFIDYKYKKGGVGPLFYPTGNFDEDMKKIERFYRDFHARHPERYNLSDVYQKK
ncbi:1-acyl-sn-glycerol-3-phosphate acyltransferase [Candidatus Sulfidibacterium hydrothermale]|uniref:1-acyl-sn-glycerol-3-phosphate acyltransferase n=1 Tax=Candidatus Sulfidibacterium hydrothermale TaxID=2875962 RepID=UPI001F0ABC1D|nr:1-acyl-sn-glycerol-3-phosphate acyltransferase [Candidatus Sulfidibacterium hydrothermale]UBM63261.1 1-acyl-sn-glycerol-3-phosphate acyltransferase [Candidatus Sulfidibacterium hydrothermale]